MKEIVPVVVAAALMGGSWSCKLFCSCTDNMATVGILKLRLLLCAPFDAVLLSLLCVLLASLAHSGVKQHCSMCIVL